MRIYGAKHKEHFYDILIIVSSFEYLSRIAYTYRHIFKIIISSPYEYLIRKQHLINLIIHKFSDTSKVVHLYSKRNTTPSGIAKFELNFYFYEKAVKRCGPRQWLAVTIKFINII